MNSIKDKHVVITGGGSGVGAQIAAEFADSGAKVTILGRRIDPLHDVAAQTGALPVSADVTNPSGLVAALDIARASHGPVAVAIANAGAAPSAPFHKISATDFNDTMSVNLNGVFNLWQATLGDMKTAGWGRLLAIASTAGLKGYGYVSHYCAAKHAVVGMTRALAHELGTSGVTANAICPGFIETPLLDRSIDAIVEKTGMSRDQASKALVMSNPQKRFVTTQEVAGSAMWLCSEAASAVNGHALALSGGEI